MIADILVQVAEALERATWKAMPTENLPEPAKAYTGDTTDGWVFLVISWDTVTTRFDGTATHAGMVVRLTTALAERAFKLAEAAAEP
jgi:hypothetical protein